MLYGFNEKDVTVVDLTSKMSVLKDDFNKLLQRCMGMIPVDGIDDMNDNTALAIRDIMKLTNSASKVFDEALVLAEKQQNQLDRMEQMIKQIRDMEDDKKLKTE